MGFMDFFKPIAKVAAGVAAPFTGGASLAAIPALDALGKASGAAANSMASNRGTKAELMLDQNSSLEKELLAREQEKRDARKSSYRDMMVGNRTMNYQPLQRPEGIRGSYTSTSTTDGARTAGGALYNQALARMGAPDLSTYAANGGMPAYNNLANNPEFQGAQKSGFLEKLLGIGSVAAPIAGLFGKSDSTPTPTK